MFPFTPLSARILCLTLAAASLLASSRPVWAGVATDPCTAASEESLKAALAAEPFNGDFTLMLERSDGRRFVHNRGASTPSTRYESASTSKMVSAAVILRLVGKGLLSLQSRPQDLIPGWPITAQDPLYAINLGSLLSFTSGLIEEPGCINRGDADFRQCVLSIATTNAGNGRIPGKEFYYSGTHLQVAGLMAIHAAGKQSWREVFNEFQAQTGHFSQDAYDLPSLTNPRLAGGMHWSASEYLRFLKALKAGRVLNTSLRAQMFADHTQSGKVTIVASPAERQLPEEDWHYGLGLWLECQSAQFDCDSARPRVSSAGAYGSYPFIDMGKNYFGMFATQGGLGTGFQGVLLERAVRPEVDRWLACPVMATRP